MEVDMKSENIEVVSLFKYLHIDSCFSEDEGQYENEKWRVGKGLKILGAL